MGIQKQKNIKKKVVVTMTKIGLCFVAGFLVGFLIGAFIIACCKVGGDDE